MIVQTQNKEKKKRLKALMEKQERERIELEN